METQFRTGNIPVRYQCITATPAVSSAPQQTAPGTLDTEVFAVLWKTLRAFPEACTAVRQTLNEVLARHGDKNTPGRPQ